MAKLLIESETLQGLANALRSVTGETRTYTPTEMIDAVTHIMETGTYILIDENGNEIPAVFVENKQVFTATANDIRIGTTAVTEAGVTVGEKEIPAYRAEEGYQYIKAGSEMDIPLYSDMCLYTVLQAIVCKYGTSITDSVFSEKVVIDGSVYDVKSTVAISTVTTNAADQTVKIGLINDSDNPIVIRYMIIKEDE